MYLAHATHTFMCVILFCIFFLFSGEILLFYWAALGGTTTSHDTQFLLNLADRYVHMVSTAKTSPNKGTKRLKLVSVRPFEVCRVYRPSLLVLSCLCPRRSLDSNVTPVTSQYSRQSVSVCGARTAEIPRSKLFTRRCGVASHRDDMDDL